MKKVLASIILLQVTTFLFAQDVMMQGWYWNYPLSSNGKNYMAYLRDYVPSMADGGFTYVWLPPLAKGSGGPSSMGYDTRDYYDVGQYGRARWGVRSEFDQLISTMNTYNVKAVSDMVFNHRDKGGFEDNPAVKGWIENMTATKIQSGDQPYPSDRVICYIPLGGTSGNVAGTYYFKIRSASQLSNFYNFKYVFHAWTSVSGQFSTPVNVENEPNGGGDCSQPDDTLHLGQYIKCSIDASGCKTDEIAVTVYPGQYNTAGDKLYFQFYNTNSTGGGASLSDMSDHFVYGVWSSVANADIHSQIVYQTATNFNVMPSGRGGMTYMNFKPNGNPTQLSGDWDSFLFYYDIDQNVQSTKDTLTEWTRWMWDNCGIRGFRLDAVKHFPYSFTGQLFNRMYQLNKVPGMVVGEFYDYNPSTLKTWVDNVNANMTPAAAAAIQIRAFDFSLRGALEQAADNTTYDVRNVFTSGMVDGGGSTGFNAVTFINNHDFRGNGSPNPVVNGVDLVYAYMLTNNQIGVPCVFFADYIRTNLLRAKINALNKVEHRYIAGATARDYLNKNGTFYTGNYSSGSASQALIYQLRNTTSGKDVVVAINFGNSALTVNHTINTAHIHPGDTLTDIMSLTTQPFMRVNTNSSIDISLAPRSYAVWVQGDMRNQLVPIDTTPIALGVNTIAVDQQPKLNLQVVPNPTVNNMISFTVASDEPERAMYEIVDLTGRSVYRQEIQLTGNATSIYQCNPSLASGMYILNIIGTHSLKQDAQLFIVP